MTEQVYIDIKTDNTNIDTNNENNNKLNIFRTFIIEKYNNYKGYILSTIKFIIGMFILIVICSIILICIFGHYLGIY